MCLPKDNMLLCDQGEYLLGSGMSQTWVLRRSQACKTVDGDVTAGTVSAEPGLNKEAILRNSVGDVSQGGFLSLISESELYSNFQKGMNWYYYDMMESQWLVRGRKAWEAVGWVVMVDTLSRADPSNSLGCKQLVWEMIPGNGTTCR